MKNSLFLSLLMLSSTQAMEQSAPIGGVIKSFESDRDLAAIEKIITADKQTFVLDGPLDQLFSECGNRKTDVMCVHDTTVGFINYTIQTADFTPYYYDIYGKIFLFGFDAQHIVNGYESRLIDSAVKNMEASGVYHIDSSARNLKLHKTYDIPADKDERSVFQKYPKTTASIASSSLLALALIASKR